jgi:hypothetical protein
MCKDFDCFLREKGATKIFKLLEQECLNFKLKIDNLESQIIALEKNDDFLQTQKNISSLKGKISYQKHKIKKCKKCDIVEVHNTLSSLEKKLIEEKKILEKFQLQIVEKKRTILSLSEQKENTQISFLYKEGFFEEKLNKICDNLGIKEGLFNSGDNAYDLFEKRDQILECLSQQEFELETGETFQFPPTNLTKNLLSSYMLKIHELSQVIKPSNGSLCEHDVERVRLILIDLGKMYHLLVPLKVRPSSHQRLAHTLEYFLHHGDNLASERPCEHNHQYLKNAIRQTMYVRNSKRLSQIIALACEKFMNSLLS